MSTMSDCDWPIESRYGRISVTCGRSGSGERIHLCWQHQEIWVREMTERISNSELNVAETVELCIVLLTQMEPEANPEADVPEWINPAQRWARTLDNLVVRRIEQIAAAEAFDRPRPSTSRALISAIDNLIEQRLAAKWSASA